MFDHGLIHINICMFIFICINPWFNVILHFTTILYYIYLYNIAKLLSLSTVIRFEQKRPKTDHFLSKSIGEMSMRMISIVGLYASKNISWQSLHIFAYYHCWFEYFYTFLRSRDFFLSVVLTNCREQQHEIIFKKNPKRDLEWLRSLRREAGQSNM